MIPLKVWHAAQELHAFAYSAAANGGFWVTPNGSTAVHAARVMARELNVSPELAYQAINVIGEEEHGEWYLAWADWQPYNVMNFEDDEDGNPPWYWTIDTIARAACRRVKR